MALENPFDSKTVWQATNRVKGIRALRDHVIVTDMDFGMRKLSSGIVLLGDDTKTDGIRPRWAKVYAVGPEQKDITVGQWVLIEHGRWTRGFKVEIEDKEFVIRRADPAAIIFAQDEYPEDAETISNVVDAQKLSRS